MDALTRQWRETFDPARLAWSRLSQHGLRAPDTTLEAERQWCLLARSVLRQYQDRHQAGMLAEVPVPSRLWDVYDHLAARLTDLLEDWPEEEGIKERGSRGASGSDPSLPHSLTPSSLSPEDATYG